MLFDKSLGLLQLAVKGRLVKAAFACPTRWNLRRQARPGKGGLLIEPFHCIQPFLEIVRFHFLPFVSVQFQYRRRRRINLVERGIATVRLALQEKQIARGFLRIE